MFVQPTKVPEPVVLAVYLIVHNLASADEWDTLDKYPVDQVLEWVKLIFELNPLPYIKVENELIWFKNELTRKMSN